MEIDLVYNYVNGSDEAWLEKEAGMTITASILPAASAITMS